VLQQVSAPDPCRYCGALISQDEQGFFFATSTEITEPWKCKPKDSPGGRHAPEVTEED
jgi:hypothetical protein